MTPAEWIPVIAAELATVDLSGAISAAELRVVERLGGEKRSLLVAYLAAHIYTVGARAAGSTGAISKISEGHASIEYTNGQNNSPTQGLSSTIYGQEFDALRRDLVLGVVVV